MNVSLLSTAAWTSAVSACRRLLYYLSVKIWCKGLKPGGACVLYITFFHLVTVQLGPEHNEQDQGL